MSRRLTSSLDFGSNDHLLVIQNNLQFVAVSNLEAATFQVSYQMKILTTAAFSVVLLRKKLSPMKWLALFFLALGVGIVQLQNAVHKSSDSETDMNAFKGFMAVVAACFTSGLAGVYFEMVLKNSSGDLWVRNVQLSLFSLLPALVPIVFNSATPSPNVTPSGWLSTSLFANFGFWAWATVITQVLGGLLTALVIKYADNILKGFATSLSIVISFLASVALFHIEITVTFLVGALVVLVATWLYNQPDTACASSTSGSEGGAGKTRWNWRWRRPTFSASRNASALELTPAAGTLSRRASTSSLSSLASFHGPFHGAFPHHAHAHAHHAQAKSYPSSPTEHAREAPFPAAGAAGGEQQQGRFFAAPLRGARTFGTRMALFRSASYADGAAAYEPLAQGPTRPGSALGAYQGQGARPLSALGAVSPSSSRGSDA